MRRIYYSSGSVLTDDAIAHAVLEYAELLGKDGRADIVELPIVLSSGRAGTATLLIGPASQIASVTEESELSPPQNEDFIADLRERSMHLQNPRPEVNSPQGAFLGTHEDYE
jgi:hypothetical protein